MAFWTKNKTKLYEGESPSIVEELKSIHTRQTSFNLPYSQIRCFMGIIKLSFRTIKGVNFKNISAMKIGEVLKSKTGGRFEISDLDYPNLYEICCEKDDVIYWTSYYVKKQKQTKSEIIIRETIKFKSSLNGFRANIGKINFNKEFDKKMKSVTMAIYEEVKNLDEF